MRTASIVGIALIITASLFIADIPIASSKEWEPTEAKVVYRSSWVADERLIIVTDITMLTYRLRIFESMFLHNSNFC